MPVRDVSGQPLNGRCKFHGGASLSGPSSATWRTGRYSKYLPKDLARRADVALNDDTLLSLEHELALLDMRMTVLLEQLGTGGNLHVLQRIDRKLQEFKAAGGKTKDVQVARAAFAELEGLIADGLRAESTWEQLYALYELKRRGIETQGKLNKDQQLVIPVVDVMGMMLLMSDEVLRHVTDRAARAAVSQIFARFAGRSDRPTLVAAGRGSDGVAVGAHDRTGPA